MGAEAEVEGVVGGVVAALAEVEAGAAVVAVGVHALPAAAGHQGQLGVVLQGAPQGAVKVVL